MSKKNEILTAIRQIKEICDRHNIDMAGCGCCGSPWLAGDNFDMDCFTFLGDDFEAKLQEISDQLDKHESKANKPF